jgi:hypothetical protein
MINATLMLCDFAQVAEGKLFIAGGGWSYTNRLHGYVACLLRIPWVDLQRSIAGSLTLVDEAGSEVIGPSEEVVRSGFDLKVAANAKADRTIPLDAPMAIPLPIVDLPMGRYKLIFVLDGERLPQCDLPFQITEQPPMPAAAGTTAQSDNDAT